MNMNLRCLRISLMGFFCLFSSLMAFAQTTLDVKGVVLDTTGDPVVGATVVVVGNAKQGAMTKLDGSFTIKGVSSGAKLKISFVGMISQEVPVSGKQIKVVLKEDSEMLDEVVVTALGIKREKKSLGYAIQEVGGSELMKAREVNIANALSGKVAGLQIVKGGNGVAGSSKIILRGNNSLTGDNQPLIVVDGVPMDNFTGSSNNDFWNPATDMGNGLGDLNPNDIESLSILKGASAAALYGSRAGNGVILITTKSGKGQQGLGLTLSSTTGFETIFMLPKLQTTFGQGGKGIYNKESSDSWGPKIEGQEIESWDGTHTEMRYYDNIRSFLRPGVNTQNSVSLSRQFGEGTSLYAALTHASNRDLSPESKLNRFNLISRFVSSFGKNKEWTADVKIQYIQTKVHNRPIGGNKGENFWSTVLTMPATVSISSLKTPVNIRGEHIWYNPKSGLNPYWAVLYSTNDDIRDRFLVNGSLKYRPTSWLTAEISGGSDIYTTNANSKTHGKSPLTPTGRYSESKTVFKETNLSFLLSANKDNLLGGLGVATTLGGNLMERRSSSVGFYIGELEVPNLFAVNNYKSALVPTQGYSHHKINSLYGTLQFNYDRLAFLDLTGRNDWSSTLSIKNRSFFYPSVSTSFVFSEFLQRKLDVRANWLTYGKLRASIASVGNDMGPYQIYNTYSVGKDPNGHTTAKRNEVLFNENVRNELITSKEVGLEMKFLSGRVGFDLALYLSNATNQLLDIPRNSLSGYEKEKINAGNIENKGFELMINAIPIETKTFTWDVTANLSKNINTVIDLAPGVTQYTLGQAFENIQILAMNGKRYGMIYGSKFARVEDTSSPYYGKVIVDKDGLPTAAPGSHILGNQQPDFMLGLTNTFQYKGLTFSFQIDGRFGGKIYSYTNYILKSNGRSALTAPNGEREDFIYDGVVKQEDGSFAPNTKSISQYDYWTKLAGISNSNVGITEDNLYDATNIRIRTASISYDLPRSWMNKLGSQGAKIGLSVNNALMLYSKMNGIDPESSFATGSNATGLEAFSNPTTRSFYVNFTLNF